MADRLSALRFGNSTAVDATSGSDEEKLPGVETRTSDPLRLGAASVMRVFSAGILFALEGRGFFPGRSRRNRLRRTHLNGNPVFRNAFLMRLAPGRLYRGRRTHAHGTDSRVCGQWDELRRPHCAPGLLDPLRCANGLPLRCGWRRSSDDPPGRSLVSRSAPEELSRFVRTSARQK